jgi:hypothetical protein
MKTLLCAIFCGIILFAACTKPDVKPSTNALTASAQDNVVIKTRTNYITAHPWKYQGWYFHYVDQQHKGDPQYIRGASNNLVGLDINRFLFKKDGTYMETQGQYRFPGTWYFTDSTATLFVLKDGNGLRHNDSLIITDNTHFNFIEFTHYHNTIYTELIPLQ